MATFSSDGGPDGLDGRGENASALNGRGRRVEGGGADLVLPPGPRARRR